MGDGPKQKKPNGWEQVPFTPQKCSVASATMFCQRKSTKKDKHLRPRACL